jgi:flagellar biosynthesis protein FlhA
MMDAIQHTAGGSLLALEPEVQQRVVADVQRAVERAMAEGKQPVVLCGNALRLPLRKLLERTVPNVHVLAYNEVSAQADVEFVGQLTAAA